MAKSDSESNRFSRNPASTWSSAVYLCVLLSSDGDLIDGDDAVVMTKSKTVRLYTPPERKPKGEPMGPMR